MRPHPLLGTVVMAASFVFFANSVFAELHPIAKSCLADYKESYDFITLKKKSSEYNTVARKVFKQAMCREPKPVLVPLMSSDPNKKFTPDHVWVNRCHGFCGPIKSCIPIADNITEISVPVKIMGAGMLKPEDGYVTVKEHHACGCSCYIQEKDCNEFQEYEAGECACLCLNKMHMAKENCLRMQHLGFEWDMNLCKCRCMREMSCSTGTTFAPELCRCILISGGGDLERNNLN